MKVKRMRTKQQLNEQEIIQQYARGMTITQLRQMYRTNFYDIRDILKPHFDIRKGPRRDMLHKHIYEDYCSGIVNYKLLANKHNVSLQVVRKVMRDNGVWKRNSFVPDYERKQRIITALQNGIPQSEIARNEGVSRQLVNAIANAKTRR